MMKRIYMAMVCACLALTGCAAEKAAPADGSDGRSSSVAKMPGGVQRASNPVSDPFYDGIIELRDDFLAAGGECAEWVQTDHAEVGVETGQCNGETVLMVFTSTADTEASAESLQSEGADLLVGPNWLISGDGATLERLHDRGLEGEYRAGLPEDDDSLSPGPYVIPAGWEDISEASHAEVVLFNADFTTGVMTTLTLERNAAARADLDTELGQLFEEDESYEDLELRYASVVTADGYSSSQGLSYSYGSDGGVPFYAAMFLFDGWVVKVIAASESGPSSDVIAEEVEHGAVREFLESLHLDQL